MSEEYLILARSLHKNNIRLNLDEHPEIKDNLKITIDGTILAVKKSAVENLLNDKEVAMIRIGYKPPIEVDTETPEGVLMLLATLASIEDGEMLGTANTGDTFGRGWDPMKRRHRVRDHKH